MGGIWKCLEDKVGMGWDGALAIIQRLRNNEI